LRFGCKIDSNPQPEIIAQRLDQVDAALEAFLAGIPDRLLQPGSFS